MLILLVYIHKQTAISRTELFAHPNRTFFVRPLKDKLLPKVGGETYRIIVWPARPLKGPRGSKLTPVTLYTATIRCVLCGNVLGAPRMRSKRSNTGDEKRRSGAGASTQTARQCPTRLMES